jgi:hypothetical protein
VLISFSSFSEGSKSCLLIPSAKIGGLTQNSNSNIVQVGGSFLFFPIMLMIVFKQKYPKWWFDWICELIKFSYRVGAYMMILTDKYPSTDEEQDVKISL